MHRLNLAPVGCQLKLIMAPVLSKFIADHPSLGVFLGKPGVLVAGGGTLLLWLASVHRTNQNRRYKQV